ncbi:hypothetical protein HKX69_29940 [Streptomyces argyrophyllae]|uniref:Uncharacterized protein n=1 Tax=Streptomyces argyrophylli TaxID=2726118 RepID=A0A6M4PWS7_9ACTN|nr:hypothetical protein [Streptomyces argyrophyllae]QJS13200.1 hypothetical protein HKX69_29940 [Streptomyces argyrophyllae]
MAHRITVEPEYRNPHCYVYNFRCSCGVRSVVALKSRGAAEYEGLKHVRMAEGR